MELLILSGAMLFIAGFMFTVAVVSAIADYCSAGLRRPPRL